MAFIPTPMHSFEDTPLRGYAPPGGFPVKFRVLNENCILPTYATDRSACFDLYACLPDGLTITSFTSANEEKKRLLDSSSVNIAPGERYMIPTGWAVQPPRGYYLRLYSRSGISLKQGLILANGVGIVDEDYRHEVCILLANISRVTVKLEHGTRVCQGEFVPMTEVFTNFQKVTATDEQWFTTNRKGGFGSTGIK